MKSIIHNLFSRLKLFLAKIADMLRLRSLVNDQRGFAISLLGVIGGLALLTAIGALTGFDFAEQIAAFFLVLLFGIVNFFGSLIVKALIFIMVTVANYNNFLGEFGVTTGWKIVRDVANLFFVAALLIIAFATVFRIEAYSYKRLLVKLVIFAVLVNFSKTIVGFAIDVGQVIMLTFVNAFNNVTAGSIIGGVGLDKILSLSNANALVKQEGSQTGGLFFALLLGLIVTVVTASVLIVIIAVFLGRIVMLWILTILSPSGFVAPLLPGGQKYSSQYWQMLAKYIIAGPILAFFLWLSFLIIQNFDEQLERTLIGDLPEKIRKEQGLSKEQEDKFAVGFSKVGEWDAVLNFMVVIGLLMGSLVITSQLSIMGSKLAGSTVARLQAGGVGAAMFFPKRLGGTIAQKWNERTARLLETKEGKKPGVGKKVLFAALNPVAAVRGWGERSKELREAAKLYAAAGGREVTEQFRTRGKVKIPYMERVESALESQYAKDYAFVPKEKKAELMVDMYKEYMKGKNVEIGRRVRALMKLAGEGGHIDDIMTAPSFRKLTKDKYVDEKGDVYSYPAVHKFFADILGRDQQGLRLLNELEEIGKRNTHQEYGGHKTYDDVQGKFKMLDLKQATSRFGAEFNKTPGRLRFSQSGHVFFGLREAKALALDAEGRVIIKDGKVQFEKDDKGNEVKVLRAGHMSEASRISYTSTFKGQPRSRIGEHTTARTVNWEVGGPAEQSYMDEDHYALIDWIDLERLKESYLIEPEGVRAFYEKAGGIKNMLRFKLYNKETGEIEATMSNENEFRKALKKYFKIDLAPLSKKEIKKLGLQMKPGAEVAVHATPTREEGAPERKAKGGEEEEGGEEAPPTPPPPGPEKGPAPEGTKEGTPGAKPGEGKEATEEEKERAEQLATTVVAIETAINNLVSEMEKLQKGLKSPGLEKAIKDLKKNVGVTEGADLAGVKRDQLEGLRLSIVNLTKELRRLSKEKQEIKERTKKK